jgi:DNA-binding transcriptional MerR regulator
MDTDRQSYSLEDLSDKTGFEVRVIRSFIEQGLLRGPSSLGRYARYSDWHLVRLLAIKALKERRGFKHSDIRQTLLCMSESEILALAETASSGTGTTRSSALDYIQSLNPQTFETQKVDEVAHQANLLFQSPGQQAPPQIEQSDSKQQIAYQSERQLPASEPWHRFQITPDVELSVRGIQSEKQMARMKSIANSLREFLIGGQNE